MSYLGRRGATAPLNSADIPDDVVQGTDIAYLENDSTTQNLGGTYSTERMYLNDSYTLNDDVTVTGHLALGSIADSDVLITQDSTERTITGSGTIESGRLMNDPTTSLTGMTGELGSTVTQASGYTLGSGVTFPAGHVIQTVHSGALSGGGSHNNHYVWVASSTNSSTITPLKANSKILIILSCDILVTGGNNSTGIRQRGYVGMYKTDSSNILVSQQIMVDDVSDFYLNFTMNYLDSPTISDPTIPITYGLATKAYWGSNSNSELYYDDGGPTHITMMEIAQ